MSKLLAGAVVVSLLSAGCLGGSKKPGFILGGAAAVVGVGLMASTGATDCSSRPALDALSCGAGDLGRAQIGLLALAVGAGIMLATAVIPTPGAEPHEAESPIIVEEPVTSGFVAAPAEAEVGSSTGMTEGAAEPADVPVASPALGTHVSMLHNLTLQARTAARHGRCLAVVAIAERVGELDPAYRHHGFAFDPHIAGCLLQRPGVDARDGMPRPGGPEAR